MAVAKRMLGAAASMVLVCACSQIPATVSVSGEEPRSSPGAASLEREIHELVNLQRSAAGLRPLDWNGVLANLAAEHSGAMAAGARPFGHDGFEARAAAARQALGTGRFSENVATNWNHPPAEVAGLVVRSWMDSPGHRRNLLDDHRLSGVGVVRSSSGEYFVTQLYAGP
ncbi:MAG: CAP domain-containing protein [Gemmatimonadota bacterium]